MEIRRIPLERELTERIHWFVKLRWLAASVVAAAGLACEFFRPELPLTPVLLVAVFLLAYNTLFRRWPGMVSPRLSIHLQIVLDWFSLTILCLFTGGLESPLIFFYLLHVMLASLFVSRRASFIHGLLAILLVWGMWAVHYTALLPASGSGFFTDSVREENPGARLIFLLAFSTVILCSIYLSSAITGRLREKEEKLLDLQESLGRACEELRELDKAKSRFVRIVAHEIRGPMAASQSLLRVAMDGYAGDINPKLRDVMERVERRILQLLDLVSELLDLVRGGQPLPEGRRSPVEVVELLRGVIRDLEGKASEKQIRMHMDLLESPGTLSGDRQDFEQIFHNLIGNAIKYTGAGGEVGIVVQPHGEDGLGFEIRDTGIGIPENDLPCIFDEFYRAADVKKRGIYGTGLGLSIVKRTVEKYGGRVAVRSVPGQGSCFTVYLPREKTEDHAG